MEDNNKNEEQENCIFCKNPVMRSIFTGILIFLGAFAAFYVVSDWHFKRMMDPAYQMRRMDRVMVRDADRIEHMARKQLMHQYRMDEKIASFVRMEKTNDAYKIIINLKPFDNNEKNVKVSVNNNVLNISAAGERATGHNQEIVRYSQNFTFGDDVDLDKLTKMKDGNDYIITIPMD